MTPKFGKRVFKSYHSEVDLVRLKQGTEKEIVKTIININVSIKVERLLTTLSKAQEGSVNGFPKSSHLDN